MMFRGDQHVDDWAEVAVDYLDGRLDEPTKLAVEDHLSGCPDCAARLRRQQYVVSFVQDTVLDEPPEDLEYRAIGEMIFPRPGGQPLGHREDLHKPSGAARWYRTLRGWIPVTVAIVALLAAVVGYSIARSGSGANLAATDSGRGVGGALTTAAASATTAAPFASEATLAGAATTVTSAGATSTTALAYGSATTEAAPVTMVATEDRKTMIQALQTAQNPTYVSFHAATAAAGTDQSTTTSAGGGLETTAASAIDTSVSTEPEPTTGSETGTTVASTEVTSTTAATNGVTLATVSEDQAKSVVDEIAGFTGLQPVDKTLWLGGPTFAVFLPREDAEELVDLVESIGTSLGLVVGLEGSPPAAAKSSSTRLLEHKKSFPVLAAHRALQPSTWGYDFTTSTLGTDAQQSGTTSVPPDEAGTHVILVIWIAE